MLTSRVTRMDTSGTYYLFENETTLPKASQVLFLTPFVKKTTTGYAHDIAGMEYLANAELTEIVDELFSFYMDKTLLSDDPIDLKRDIEWFR